MSSTARRDALAIYEIYERGAFPDEELRAINVIGGERRVRHVHGHWDRVAGLVDDDAIGRIPSAYAAHIADVMHQAGEQEMHGVGRVDLQMDSLSFQDFPAHLSDEDRVFEVVIQGVADANALDRQARGVFDNLEIATVAVTESPLELIRQRKGESAGNQRDHIKHHDSPSRLASPF